jgi:outer membrane protein OmpA-like peptidoglycan-associated protein
MANVLYDIHLTDRFSLTLGAGAGGANARLKLGAFDDGGPEGEFIKDSDTSFAYQGIAGLNYAIGPRSSLFVNYHYLDVTNANFTVPGESAKFDDLRNHTVTLGFRFALSPQEEAAPPPPPLPPEAPPAPPPPEVKHFIIFFGFNKCNITGEADSVLSQAASTAKSSGAASISIVGHTDTVGSDKYNKKLSICRANAARTNLVGKGVPEGAISVEGKGETELMVQTGDNVKEPQNRRATVDLH